jgi:hypothetical protein
VTQDSEQDLEEPRSSRPSGARRRPVLATVLAALCLLLIAAGVAVYFYVRPAATDTAAAEDRANVVQASERFVETWNTFTAKDAPTYVKEVAPLLTTKFRTEFTNASHDVINGIQQQGLSSSGKVLVDEDGVPLVGIERIDPDSASVLVVSDANRVSNGQKVLRHWRWEVELDKVGGRWLVDSFKEI